MLDLSDNDLNGTIPASIGICTKLYDLNVANNSLTGTLPATMSGLVVLLTTASYAKLTLCNNEVCSLPTSSVTGRLANLECLSRESDISYFFAGGSSLVMRRSG